MRELKFRAWDIKEKVMHKAGFLFDSDGTIFDNTLCDGEMESFSFGSGQIILMQYVGLKDKNGKEVYEGDILKDNYGRILLVEWYKYGFSFKAITETNFLRARDISQWFENGERLPEIIGNLYENQELMEAADK